MFQSKRIQLRKVTESDAEIYHQWRGNIEVMENTNPVLDVYTFAETEEFISNICHSDSSKSYIIERNDGDLPIGIVSLIHLDYKNRNGECVIDIGNPDYWGEGYGKEAMHLILKYSFLELNLHKVYLRVFSFNERACHLYESLGFEKEGELKEQLFRKGKWHGISYYAIFQDSYLQG